MRAIRVTFHKDLAVDRSWFSVTVDGHPVQVQWKDEAKPDLMAYHQLNLIDELRASFFEQLRDAGMIEAEISEVQRQMKQQLDALGTELQQLP
jgi:hypothetical protein